MPTLVTGGAGFVGQHLLRALLGAGEELVATTMHATSPEPSVLTPAEVERIRWLTMDLTDAASVERAVRDAGPDRIYHLAAQSSVGGSLADPIGTWNVNAMGTLRLLQAVRSQARSGCRLVLISSAEVYGDVPEPEQPIREDRPISPRNPYGASKAAAEIAALQGDGGDAVEVVIARSFNHIGPGQDARFAIPSFASQIRSTRAGESGATLRVGNLSARRDLLDVRDVVEAYRILMARGRAGERYNVCGGVAFSMRELLDRMIARSAKDLRVEVDPARLRPVDTPLLLGDASKLRALGWAPGIAIDRTLDDLLREVPA